MKLSKKLIVCLSICALISCQKPISKTEAKKELEINGPLLAQVGDWAIGLDDFERRVENLKSIFTSQADELDSYEFKRRILNELVRTEMLAQEAILRGMDKERDFKEAVQNYKRNLLAQKLIKELSKDIIVTDTEIEDFYNKNKNFFKEPPEVKVRELVVRDKSLAKELYIRLLQGESFVTLAKTYSIAKSKEKGGDLGYITYDPSKKFKKFWEVVFTLDKGEISNIFKGDDGNYYIVKLEDKKEEKFIPLSEVRDQIKEALEQEKLNKKIEDIITKVKSEVKVVVNEELLR